MALVVLSKHDILFCPNLMAGSLCVTMGTIYNVCKRMRRASWPGKGMRLRTRGKFAREAKIFVLLFVGKIKERWK